MLDQVSVDTDPADPKKQRKNSRAVKVFNCDFLIILFFTFISLFFFLGRWNGLYPALLFRKYSDAGALMMYAAALDHPENFQPDLLLNLSNHYFAYTGIYLPVIRFLASIFHDYGMALLILLPVCVFLQLSAFYTLGKTLFNNRFWALLLAVVTAVPIYLLFWDFWGFYFDPLPRFLFQAIMPFFLNFAIKWREKPKFLLLLMFLTSLLFFIHAVSTPALGFMIWCGFYLSLPNDWKRLKKIGFQIISALCFLIPFSLFTFLSKAPLGPSFSLQSASYTQVIRYLSINYSDFINIKDSFNLFLVVLLASNILIPAIIGLGMVYATKFERQLKTNMVLVWLAACFLVSFIIPWVEHEIENQLQIVPIQLDIIRNSRYLIPLLMILVLSGFVTLLNRFKSSFSGKKAATFLVVFTYISGLFWVSAVYGNYIKTRPIKYNFVPDAINCLFNHKLFCPTTAQVDESEMLNYIKENTPINSRFLSVPKDSLGIEIRYAGLRSVAYTEQDSRIAYANFAKAIEVDKLVDEWNMIKQFPVEIQLPLFEKFSCQVGATHWVIDTTDSFPVDQILPDLKIVFQNSTFRVFELPPCSK